MATKRQRKKQSQTQQEYNKQRRRIQQFINRAEKRGYLFPDNIIPDRPKRVTKASVNRLAKLTPDKLYAKAEYVDVETGEILPGKAGRVQERSKTAKRAAQTRTKKKAAEITFWKDMQYIPEETANIIRGRNFVNDLIDRLGIPITTYYTTDYGTTRRRRAEVTAQAESARQRILDLVYQRMNEMGEELFGKYLQQHVSEISQLIDSLRFSSDGTQVNSAYTELVSIINGGTISIRDNALINYLEEYEEEYDV